MLVLVADVAVVSGECSGSGLTGWMTRCTSKCGNVRVLEVYVWSLGVPGAVLCDADEASVVVLS